MKFSTRTEYGLRAMAELARYYNKKTVSLASIAKKEKISQAYLERLIAGLKKDCLVKSTKGVKGGYRLTKNPKDITLLEIIECLDGPIVIFQCLVEKSPAICNHQTCLTKKVWRKLQVEIMKILKTTKLSDLV